MTDTPRTVVILNPRAAAGRAQSEWPRVEQRLREAIGVFDLERTAHPGHAAELVRRALRNGVERVVSVGGDGTHHECVNGFFEGAATINPNAILAPLPIGTGSDLARTLGLPRGVDAVSWMTRGALIRADVGRVTYVAHDGREQNSHFLNVADFGAGGAVAERVNQGSKQLGGFASFFLAVVRTLLTYRAPRFELTIDGETCAQKALSVIVANAEYYGGGIHVAREAVLDEGWFEVLVVHDLAFAKALANLHRFYVGDVMARPDLVRIVRARHVALSSPDRVLINLDGEQPGTLPARVELVPGALRLMTARRTQSGM